MTGVCAPFDQSDCDYTLKIATQSDYAWGRADIEAKTIWFGGNFYNVRDCWGMTIWQHEWYHMAVGPFHLNGPECMLRHGMFRS